MKAKNPSTDISPYKGGENTRYPFTPELLDALPEELCGLFRGLELWLLEEICSRLRDAGQLNEVTVQGIRALRAHGIDLADIKKAVAQSSGVGLDRLDRLLGDVAERNRDYYTGLFDAARVTAPQRLVDAQDIEAIRRQTADALRSITRSMGFAVDGGRTMLKPAGAYQWALDQAALRVQSGAASYNQAIADAVRQLADSGLKTVSYESGRTDSVDTAVRRAVMTGVNQLNQRYREQSMEYLGTDLVEVTAHAGARDTDGPNGWENHKKWQGKVYQWKKDGEQAEQKRRQDAQTSVQEAIRRGDYPLTINPEKQARHMAGTALPGRSVITVSMEELQEIVYQQAGHGKIDLTEDFVWKNRETVNAGKEIGYTVNRNGDMIKAYSIKIHYSKTGVHVVPYSGR